MRVFLDDKRTTPPGWHRCYTPAQVIECLQQGTVTAMSLDHDLGLPPDDQGREVSGYTVLLWLEEQLYLGRWEFTPIPEITIHSDNGPGIANMPAAALAAAQWEEQIRIHYMECAIESIKRRVDNT